MRNTFLGHSILFVAILNVVQMKRLSMSMIDVVNDGVRQNSDPVTLNDSQILEFNQLTIARNNLSIANETLDILSTPRKLSKETKKPKRCQSSGNHLKNVSTFQMCTRSRGSKTKVQRIKKRSKNHTIMNFKIRKKLTEMSTVQSLLSSQINVSNITSIYSRPSSIIDGLSNIYFSDTQTFVKIKPMNTKQVCFTLKQNISVISKCSSKKRTSLCEMKYLMNKSKTEQTILLKNPKQYTESSKSIKIKQTNTKQSFLKHNSSVMKKTSKKLSRLCEVNDSVNKSKIKQTKILKSSSQDIESTNFNKIKQTNTKKSLFKTNFSLIIKKSSKKLTTLSGMNDLLDNSKLKLTKTLKSSLQEVECKQNGSSRELRRKSLRQELIELLRNQSRTEEKKAKSRKKLFAKPVTVAPLKPTSSAPTASLIAALTVCPTLEPIDNNFLYSAESESGGSPHSEHLLDFFDEVRLTPVRSDKRLDVFENEQVLYIPKNISVKPQPMMRSKKQRSTRARLNASRIKSNLTRSRGRKRMTLESLETVGTHKSQLSTSFHLYDIFLQHNLLERHKQQIARQLWLSTIAPRVTRVRKYFNISQFLLSPEGSRPDSGGNIVFSESFEHTMPDFISTTTLDAERLTLGMKDLPDTKECEEFWNHTFTRGKTSGSIQPPEIGTLNSEEAWRVLGLNASNFLTTDSILSNLKPYHPLLDPFITKFDESILPNAREAREIFARYFNESVEVFDHFVPTTASEEFVTVCPLKRLNEYDFADMSLSYEWKNILMNMKVSTERTTMTDPLIELPDTKEAASIFRQQNWPNLFKTSLARRKQPSTKPPELSTLSFEEAKLLLGRLGVELFGQKIRIDLSPTNRKRKSKVIQSKTKSKIMEKVFKDKKLGGYLKKMMTGPSVSNEVKEIVQWQSEQSEIANVKLNFNMKLFLSKLCTYLGDSKNSKLENETLTVPVSKRPPKSFLIGKPAYFKRRKNALI